MVLTEAGIAVVEGDTHLSRYVREQGRLDIALVRDLIGQLHRFIPEQGAVADIGACLGDHTLAYAQRVGRQGRVYAFEPNPVALECLRHNLKGYPQVRIFDCALSNIEGRCTIGPHPWQPKNLGMATMMEGEDVVVKRLDTLALEWPRLDFLKLDTEGVEPAVLLGAERTLARHRPVILFEVNQPLLAAHGTCAAGIYGPLTLWGYRFIPVMDPLTPDPITRFDQPEIDVVAIPRERYPDMGYQISCT